MTSNAWTLASASALALLAPMAAHAQTAQGVVQGRVVSAGSGEPLVGAEVTTSAGARTTTDEAGRFRLADVAAGAVVVRASYLGLPVSETSVSVSAGGEASVTLALGGEAPSTLTDVGPAALDAAGRFCMPVRERSRCRWTVTGRAAERAAAA